ncbi:MAG: DeoR/GlpR family transcriptional regulator of sugar metabolism [Oceanospirillaceae bacterium]
MAILTNSTKNVLVFLCIVRYNLVLYHKDLGDCMGFKAKQRQSQILDIIGEKGQETVENLARNFSVSHETIRRDLCNLADVGALRKIYGGAKQVPQYIESSFSERMFDSVDAKKIIARKLANIIEPDSTVFLDTGSTTLICAQQLMEIERLTVITNSLHIAQVLGKSTNGSAVYLLGGKYAQDNNETTGTVTIEQINGYQVDYAVLCAAAIDLEIGVTDANCDEAQIAMAMINCANRVIIVADSSKLNRKAAYRVCKLGQLYALVSDNTPAPSFVSALGLLGIQLH